MDQDEKVALLGDVSEGGALEPELQSLKTFHKSTSVIAAFCKQCGAYHELAYGPAEEIFMSMQEPLVFENKYLIFGSCSECKGDDKTIQLKTF